MAQLRIACLLGQGFEDSEFRVPYDKLKAAGMEVEIIGMRSGEDLRGYRAQERVKAERSIDDARPDQYQALFIPGGHSPDNLRADPRFVRFVKEFDATGRPIAAICHGAQLLISAGLVRGRTLTAWKTVQEDLRQIGANVQDQPVVTDRNWITSRQPSDLEAFSEEVIRTLRAGVQPSRGDLPQPFARKGEQTISEAAEEELPSQRPTRSGEQEPGMRAESPSGGARDASGATPSGQRSPKSR